MLWLNILAIVIFSSLALAALSLAPWVPARANDLERIANIADLKKGQKFFEMGCGNGRVCIYMARKFLDTKVVGMELSFVMYLVSKVRAYFLRLDNLEILYGNALKYDISDTDVVYVFGLIDTVNKKVKKFVEEKMKDGGMLISYSFAMKEWGGRSEKFSLEGKRANIYVYWK